jgi:histidine triad (HIT) family protein
LLSRNLFRLARNDFAGSVVQWVFAHAAWALPVRKVATTSTVIAFHHPRPSWETHILLVPKVGIPSLLDLDQANESIVLELMLLADSLGRDLTQSGEETRPLSLIVNGGAYQDVGQLHFHLVAGSSVQEYRCPGATSTDSLIDSNSMFAFRHPSPIRETHVVLGPKPAPPDDDQPESLTESQVRALVTTTRNLVQEQNLAPTGFSLIAGSGDGRLDYWCFHLVSGKHL